MSVTKVIVHIGLPKTGSSSIQRFLSANKSLLKKNGVFYSPKSSFDHCAEITEIVQSGEEQRLSSFLQHQLKSAEEEQCTMLIISSECLFERARWVKSTFSKQLSHLDSEYICYFRNIGDYYLAAWQQWFYKSESFDSFDSYIKNFGKVSGWMTHFKEWEEVAHERLVVRPFDRKKLFNENLNEDFLNNCSIPIAYNLFNEPEVKPNDIWGSNRSFDARGNFLLETLSEVAQGDIHDHSAQLFLAQELSELVYGTQKKQLSRDQAWILNFRHKGLIEYLESKYPVLIQSIKAKGYESEESVDYQQLTTKLIKKLWSLRNG